MRFLLLPLFALVLFCSCGDSASSDESSNETEIPEAVLFDMSSPDSLISSYKRLRTAEVDPSEDFSIRTEVFYQEGDFFIVNFEETWGNYSYPFACAVNTNEIHNELMEADGVYSDISTFLVDHSAGATGFYLGSFEGAPNYDLYGYTMFLLSKSGGYNTTISNSKRLFGLNGMNLFETKMAAYTEGEGGICDDIIGYRSAFVLGKDPKDIIIEVVENKYEDCELIYSVKYKKIWDNYSDDMDNAEPRIQSNCTKSSDFKAIAPLKFFNVYPTNDGKDTFVASGNVYIQTLEYEAQPYGAILVETSNNDYYSTTIFGVKRLTPTKYELLTRPGTMLQIEREEMMIRYLEQDTLDSELYYLSIGEGDKRILTTNEKKYAPEPSEEDEF